MRECTYIIYPSGYDIRAQIEERKDGIRRICFMEGATCPKGRAYVEQEVTALQRDITTPVLIKGSILPLVSVRLTSPIPRDRVFDTMDKIKKCILTIPVKAGAVAIPHLLGCDADVTVTKSVPGNGCRQSQN